ncbi:MAG: prepilin-type N-terminal cleavage/methylation domain-containing protein [Gammaproteobacteria bacterium]|nr:prepilin-type N-terminal cleavage/methylation domain-containing protein [Gammaproteobacteria bacterium]
MKKNENGLTLVELMIGLVVGAVVVGGAGAIYVTTIISSGSNLTTSKLNQELSAVMQLMTNDIRRAGFGGDSFTAINISNTGSCVQYRYDLNLNGAVNTSNPNEQFGFGLNGDAIAMKKSATGNCGSFNALYWENITDDDLIEITAVNITTSGSTCIDASLNYNWRSGAETVFPCQPTAVNYSTRPNNLLVEARQLNIDISARLKADTSVTRSASAQIKIRNNRTLEAP